MTHFCRSERPSSEWHCGKKNPHTTKISLHNAPLHANKRWSKAISTNLWPYAIRMANDVLNKTPNFQDKAKHTADLFKNKELQAPTMNALIDPLPATKRKGIQWGLPSEGEDNPVAKKSWTETENDRV
jgi:hypothetical protein